MWVHNSNEIESDDVLERDTEDVRKEGVLLAGAWRAASWDM